MTIQRNFLRVLFCVFFLFSGSGGLHPPDSVFATDSKPHEVANSYEAVNVIAAPRVLYDSFHTPDTRIDVGHVFDKHPKFDNVKPEITVLIPGKKEIAEAKMDGDTLVLEWRGIGKSQITIRATNHETGQFVDNRVTVEAWAPSFLTMAFTVLGGLGIFLIGMKFLSDGLQMYAGSSLRRMIATLTDNRFSAVLVGLVTTVLIQSSSVTTVMTVGFINSQIMTLSQGIGVIMGANIGTTITGWIMIMKISQYALPIIGVSGLIYLFSQSEKTRFLAMSVVGLGFVFFGLELMQTGMGSLRELPSFSMIADRFTADTYWGVLKCVAAGCVITLVVQSSSATVGITLSLIAVGAIEFNTAAALILGENIGTTITAMLASIGTSINARRAAVFHCLFNVIGVAWASAMFLPVFIPTILYWVGTNPETGAIADPKFGVALTHSLFNVTNVLLFLPFTGVFAAVLTRFVGASGDMKEKKIRLTNLHFRLLETSAISIEHSQREIQRMGGECCELAERVRTILDDEIRDEKIVEMAFRQEELLDAFQDEIIEFMADLLANNVSHEVAITARGQLHMTDELESISDYLIVILKSHLKLQESNLAMPELERDQMREVYLALLEYMRLILKLYAARQSGTSHFTEIHSQGRTLTFRIKTIRDNFLRRMSDERFDPQIIAAVNTQLNAFRRVREHTQNVAEGFMNH